MFISYAQNQEDVMLYRAFKHVKKGFYIDVGAQHPVFDSVTKAFYDRGWRGINIEPIPDFFDKLISERPEDINLDVAASSFEGYLQLYEFPETGLSTSIKQYALNARESGIKGNIKKVPCSTLDAICRQYEVNEIHFLKIDVEGAEKDVLEGFSFNPRPWILVIEATQPNSTIDISGEWEPIVLSHGYHFVYFDGLNRFFLADEHKEMLKHFLAPPNFFDKFVRYEYELAMQTIRERDQTIAVLNQRLTIIDNEIRQIRNSLSWQITAPLRFLRKITNVSKKN